MAGMASSVERALGAAGAPGGGDALAAEAFGRAVDFAVGVERDARVPFAAAGRAAGPLWAATLEEALADGARACALVGGEGVSGMTIDADARMGSAKLADEAGASGALLVLASHQPPTAIAATPAAAVATER